MIPEIEELYQEVILDHSRRPRNFGELADAAVRVHGDNPACGDEIHLGVKFDASGGLEDIRFTGHGCAISQASASLLTDEVKGKPVEAVAGIEATDVLDLLGIDISPARLKCAMLSHDTLHHVLDELGADGAATAAAPTPTAAAAESAS